MGRRLERHVDWDLADRIAASGPIKKQPRTKTSKTPRSAATYRGAQRNVDRIKGWPSATSDKRRPLARDRGVNLNRSDRWPRAKSYQHAREIGPSSEVVR